VQRATELFRATEPFYTDELTLKREKNMTILNHLLPIIYKPLWTLFKTDSVAFYAEDPLDYEMFLPIKKHLDYEVINIAKNKKTRAYFEKNDIPYKRYPFFPKAVIMGRHSAYKFPVKKIKKIGFDHGLYQFKRWTSVVYYNQFDIYFVSSEEQVLNSREMGIVSTRAIGYPKLDKVFDGSIDEKELQKLKDSMGLENGKKTVIFTSTWDVAALSALTRWVDRVGELVNDYNVLLTAHPWTKEKLIKKLREVEGAFYLEESDISKYLMIADLFVGDYNSLIGEFCALDKPLITFKVPESDRTVAEVRKMIAEISHQVDTFDEIPDAISHELENANGRQAARKKANKKLFFALDGKAGERAAEHIKELIG
jgi:hypothetical protein